MKSFVIFSNFCISPLAPESSNCYEIGELNEEQTIRVVNTPPIIYEEPGITINNAQSDLYSEAGITIHTITNAMYGMNSQQSTNNEYVSYHWYLLHCCYVICLC